MAATQTDKMAPPTCFTWVRRRARRAATAREEDAQVPSRSQAQEPALMRLNLQKGPRDRLGAAVTAPGGQLGKDLGGALIIVQVSQEGLIRDWNEGHPSQAVLGGDVIVEVNGHTDSWAMLDEIGKPGALELLVRRPPQGGSMQFDVQDADDSAPRRREAPVRRVNVKHCCGPVASKGYEICVLPMVRAGDVGVDECAICMEASGPEDMLAQLACGHAFHNACLMKWSQKRPVCPLCIRRMQ